MPSLSLISSPRTKHSVVPSVNIYKKSLHWICTPTGYPSKGSSLILCTNSFILTTQHSSVKSSNMKSFHPSEPPAYVNYGYPIKHLAWVPNLVPLIAELLDSTPLPFWRTKWIFSSGVKSCPWITSHYFIAHIPNYYKNKHKNISLYRLLPVFFVSILCS